MSDYTPRLIAAGPRRGYRPAPQRTIRPVPAPPEFDGAYCRGCGQIDECDCDQLFGVEAVPDEPDLEAARARIEAAGGLVMSLGEWAAESCPSLAAEAETIRNANSPADL